MDDETNYFLKIAVVISQATHVCFFNGRPDITLSARCYIDREKKGWSSLYKALNLIYGCLLNQENHCMISFMYDVKNSQYVRDIATKEGLL